MNRDSRTPNPLWPNLKRKVLVRTRTPIVLLCLVALVLGVLALLAVVSASGPGAASKTGAGQADPSAQWCAEAESYLAARAETLNSASELQYQAMANALDENCSVDPTSRRSSEEVSTTQWCARAESYLAARAENLDAASELQYQAMANTLDENCDVDPMSRRSGEEASSARWSALGAYYIARYEAAAVASAARYQALAAHYGVQMQQADLERGAAASAARWNLLGAHYAAKYEAAAAASSARYQALADWYAHKALSGRH
jgi:hypothetical protein